MIEVNCSSSESAPGSRTEKGLSISWLVPSTSFVLQEYLELTAPKWTDVAVVTLNLTNLHLEVRRVAGIVPHQSIRGGAGGDGHQPGAGSTA